MKNVLALFPSILLMACTVAPPQELPRVNLVEYQLSAGDRLRLDVFREKDLSGEYVIDGQGFLNLPMAGNIMAAGKTLPEFRTELSRILSKEYVRNATITLDIMNYRPIYILGEIQKPGEYDYVDGMSVFALVAKAGGFTYRANQGRVYLRHSNEDHESAYRLTSGAAILPGDTIRIVSRFF